MNAKTAIDDKFAESHPHAPAGTFQTPTPQILLFWSCSAEGVEGQEKTASATLSGPGEPQGCVR